MTKKSKRRCSRRLIVFLPVTVVLDGVDMCKIKPPKISKIHVLGFSLTNLSLKDGLKVCNYFNYDKFI